MAGEVSAAHLLLLQSEGEAAKQQIEKNINEEKTEALNQEARRYINF